MLQKKRFGSDCGGTAGSHGSDRRDDQMSHQDEPIPHAANNDRAGGKLQDYETVADFVRILIRRGQGDIRHALEELRGLKGRGEFDPDAVFRGDRDGPIALSVFRFSRA
jgi:hypothetical protein